MEKHITLVGVLNIVYRAWAAIGGFFVLALGLGFEPFMRWLREEGLIGYHEFHEIPDIVFDIVPFVLIGISTLILLVSLAGIIGGIGVLQRREWGRITVLIVSFFNLLRIPLGTLLGGYSLWALMNDETIRLFNSPSGT